MPLPKDKPIDIEYLTSADFWSRVDVRGPDDCWPWRLRVASHGYGMATVLPYSRRGEGPAQTTAHRAAWALHHQTQIPNGMTIDHRPECVRTCCNPTHLRPLDNVENARGNQQLRKTHCPKGHPYEGDNVRTYTNPTTGKACRKCVACQIASNKARYS